MSNLILKTIIVDDEDLALDYLELMLIPYPEIQLIGKFCHAREAFEAISKLKPDLVISDIQMPKLTGLELVSSLDYSPLIIFTTAFSNFAIEAFNLEVLDYLVKPIESERFKKAIEKSIKQFELQTFYEVKIEKPSLALKKNGIETIVGIENITHIEGMKQYAIVHTNLGKFYLNETLISLTSKMEQYGFKRIHKSFIVNVAKITKAKASAVYIDALELPVGRSFKL
jgi:DNA-binding LytR/AlgR family response regulator